MKYFILLTDGLADEPITKLNNATPLEAASTPYMDLIASAGHYSMLSPTPKGCTGGSEVGNLTILGYDPRVHLTGRSPIEAAAIGIDMAEDDVALRCNFITLSNEADYSQKRILDYSAGEITTQEAGVLIDALNNAFANEKLDYHLGLSYRHCLILHHEGVNMTLTPPHNALGERVENISPKGDASNILYSMMEKSYDILSNHPINLARIEKGLNPANSVWFWGQGRPMTLPSFKEKYGISGGVITAVDLVRGIAKCAQMNIYSVEGATGTIHTNFDGKAAKAIDAFKNGEELVYLHIEAPDECSHQLDVHSKILSAECADSKLLRPVLDYLVGCGEDYAILIASDHPTLSQSGKHSSADVAYAMYFGKAGVYPTSSTVINFCEATATQNSNGKAADGLKLMESFIKGKYI